MQQLSGFTTVGFVRLTASYIFVEPDSRFVLRDIAMCFDAYLKNLSKGKPIFSRRV